MNSSQTNSLLLLLTLCLFLPACSIRADSTAEINSFQKCVDAGNPIMRSYPARCVTKDGKTFVDSKEKSQLKKERGCQNLCGNGSCEEMVCMAVGCPCAESSKSCPEDCSGS